MLKMQDDYSKTLFQSKRLKWETGKKSAHYSLTSIFNVEKKKWFQINKVVILFFGPSNRNIGMVQLTQSVLFTVLNRSMYFKMDETGANTGLFHFIWIILLMPKTGSTLQMLGGSIFTENKNHTVLIFAKISESANNIQPKLEKKKKKRA